jgi:hypothetical protein
MVPAEATTAAAWSRSYPFFAIAGIMTPPTAAASAAAEPDIPAKIMEARTVMMARPPGIQPTRAREKFVMRFPIPPALIKSPARTKNGRASRVKDSLVLTIDWKITAGSYFPDQRKKRRGVRPMAKARGIAVQERPRKSPQMTTKFTL